MLALYVSELMFNVPVASSGKVMIANSPVLSVTLTSNVSAAILDSICLTVKVSLDEFTAEPNLSSPE